MSRRPNAKGGKFNKGPKNTATRARFSNYRAPTKRVQEQFKSKQSNNRQRGGDSVRPTSQHQLAPNFKVAPKQNTEGKDQLERILIKDNVLRELCQMFGFSTSAPIDISLHKKKDARTRVSNHCGEVESSSPDQTVAPTPLPFQLSKPSKRPAETDSVMMKYQRKYDKFIARGFSSDVAFSCTNVLKTEVPENELLLTFLMTSIEHSAPSPSQGQLTGSAEPILFNEEIMMELEVLESIYNTASSEESVPTLSSQHIVLFNSIPCTRIDVKFLSSVGGAGSTREKEIVCHVVLFITNADKYPAEGSMLYGWVLPQVEKFDASSASWSVVSSSNGIEDDKYSMLVGSDCRELSLRAMRDIHSQLMTDRAPVAFDFIQIIVDGLLSCSLVEVGEDKQSARNDKEGKSGAAATDKKSDMGKKNHASKSIVFNKTSHNKSKVVDFQEDESAGGSVSMDIVRPKPLVKPLTSHRECREYREAYLEALNKGLKGVAAREEAKDTLQYILPTSVMEALAIEEEYAESLLERACSVETMGDRAVIEGARVLAERLRINKPHAKTLFMAGKDALYRTGDWFARDEVSLRDKCISSALAVHQAELERRDAKKQKKREEREERRQADEGEDDGGDGKGRRRGRKHRGPTIRDAYDIAGRRVKDDGDGDDSSDSGSDAESDEDIARVNTKKYPYAQPEAEGMGYNEEEEEPELSEHDIRQEAERKERDRQRKQLQNRQLQNALAEKGKSGKYREILARRSNLPAYKMKDTILRSIAENSVVVISGDTGCGKTTQIPQMVLDQWMEEGRGAYCNILVTQPRRISAVSVAEHIARERIEPVGQSTGYHIRLETKKGPSTRLLLMTTGVLLRRLQTEGDLEGVSHVFVDEVHERDVNTDFLLIVLKRLLGRRPDLKIVLMSATLNADLFLSHFRSSRREYGYGSCGMITIPGRAFPVETFYLEDALQKTGYEITADSAVSVQASRSRDARGGGDERSRLENERRERLAHIEQMRSSRKYSDRTIMSLKQVDESKLNVELIRELVVHIMRQPLPPSDASESGVVELEGAILIFVAGLSDIRDVIDCLEACTEISGSSGGRGKSKRSGAIILPLHSSLSSRDQSHVFQVPPSGVRKIIVSTNIAETSVTIEDVVYVIDTCRVKETRYDEECQMDVLEEQWISKANARQRRGRAGRVRRGVCFHLASGFTVDALPDFTVPEMLRMSLEDIVLQILALDLGNPFEFLLSAISPPTHQSVSRAILYLESLNAVMITNVDTSNPEVMLSLNNAADTEFDLMSEITPLGYHLAALPISPRIGKLILYGVLLKCVEPILIIASTVSGKSPFVVPFGERDAADAAKSSFLEGNSDLLSMLNVFKIWKDQFGTTSSRGRGGSELQRGRDKEEEEFCRMNFLSIHSLRLIDQMCGQFLGLLQSIGFMPENISLADVKNCPENKYGKNLGVVKCAICAGLSPSILMAPSASSKKSSIVSLGKNLLEVALLTRRRGMPMYVHPSSVMGSCQVLDSQYMVYVEAMKTSKMYVRDVTTISPLTLAIFSGRLTARSREELVFVDGWIKFAASSQVIKCLNRVRDIMEDAFIQKVLDPLAPPPEEWTRVLTSIMKCYS